MDAHRRCRPFYTSSGAHERLDARRGCPIVPSPSSKFLYQKARLKSHPLAPFANPHQPSPNVNDSAPRPLFFSVRPTSTTTEPRHINHLSRHGKCSGRQRPCPATTSRGTDIVYDPDAFFVPRPLLHIAFPGRQSPPPRSPVPRPLLHTTFPGCQSPPRSPAPFPWCPLRRRGPAPNVNDYRAATKSPRPLLHNAFPGCQSPPRSPAPFPWCPLRRRGPAQNVNDYRAAERRDHSVSALAG